jgi:hypothetical protein
VTQMAKRMRFSVVGLPHYTVWHLYEPSADDLKHMERMEEEKRRREAEERAQKERDAKLKQTFDDSKGQWEKDKKQIVQKAQESHENGKILAGGEAGPHAHAGEGEAQGKAKPAGEQAKVSYHSFYGREGIPSSFIFQANPNGLVDTAGKPVEKQAAAAKA